MWKQTGLILDIGLNLMACNWHKMSKKSQWQWLFGGKNEMFVKFYDFDHNIDSIIWKMKYVKIF